MDFQLHADMAAHKLRTEQAAGTALLRHFLQVAHSEAVIYNHTTCSTVGMIFKELNNSPSSFTDVSY